MRFAIRHEIKNRIRVHLPMDHLSFREADTLEYYLRSFEEVTEVRVYERTADAVIFFDCDRLRITEIVSAFFFYDVQDPGNVGTLIRTADAFGFSKIILSNSCDIYNPKVVRSTMGSLFRLRFLECLNFETLLDSVKNIKK